MGDLTYPMLASLLECAQQALSDDPPARVCVIAGDVAYDDCCEGQLWTRLISLTPSMNGVDADLRQLCGVLMWSAVVGLGVVRCAAVVDDSGTAPPPEVLEAEAAKQAHEAEALWQAVQCCFAPGRALPVRAVRWAPIGPDGGCVGGEWNIVVGLDNCGCPPVAAPYSKE